MLLWLKSTQATTSEPTVIWSFLCSLVGFKKSAVKSGSTSPSAETELVTLSCCIDYFLPKVSSPNVWSGSITFRMFHCRSVKFSQLETCSMALSLWHVKMTFNQNGPTSSEVEVLAVFSLWPLEMLVTCQPCGSAKLRQETVFIQLKLITGAFSWSQKSSVHVSLWHQRRQFPSCLLLTANVSICVCLCVSVKYESLTAAAW